MKNITVSLEDELYRKARVAAAEADTTVTGLVREFLTHFSGAGNRSTFEPSSEVLKIIETMRKRHPGFNPANRLSREEVHVR